MYHVLETTQETRKTLSNLQGVYISMGEVHKRHKIILKCEKDYEVNKEGPIIETN